MNSKIFYTAAILCLAVWGGAQQNAADVLPKPYATPAVRNNSKVIGWPEGKTPIAPEGFVVKKYAGDMKNPRWIYMLPNNDVLISCANTGTGSANVIMLFRGLNSKGQPVERDTFLRDLTSHLVCCY